MNYQDTPEERRVMPNWRYFYQTQSLGELENYSSAPFETHVYPIDDYIASWIEKKGVYRAGELISEAIANGQKDNPHVVEAADYIISQKITDNPALVNTARYITEAQGGFSDDIKKLSLGAIAKLTTAQDVQEKIHNIRILLHRYPYNAILYVDMARAYVSVGMLEKADNLMKLALWLAPNNRFVARAAARLKVHRGNLDEANYILHHTELLKYDPWLISTEISVNTARNKTSSLIKKGVSMINSGNYHPFSFTELSSAIGTVEMFYGSRKKSRDMFKSSLISPNDNSLAQAEWAVINHVPILVESEKYNLRCDFESKAYKAIAANDANGAVHHIVDWICDMPFSHKPITLGSNLSMEYLKDFELAAKILEVGLKANPGDDLMLNNIAYALARNNQPKEARKFMSILETMDFDDMSYNMQACVRATQGLIAYREKNFEEGYCLYSEAVKIAEENKDKDEITYLKAIINFIREQLIASGCTSLEPLQQLPRLDGIDKNNDLLILKQEVEDLAVDGTIKPIKDSTNLY